MPLQKDVHVHTENARHINIYFLMDYNAKSQWVLAIWKRFQCWQYPIKVTKNDVHVYVEESHARARPSVANVTILNTGVPLNSIWNVARIFFPE